MDAASKLSLISRGASRPLGRNLNPARRTARIPRFVREKRGLVRESAAIADERVVTPNDAMARDHDAKRIPADRAADRLRGHLVASAPLRDPCGDVAI